MNVSVNIERLKIEQFCQKWKIREFSIFGSAVGGEFREDSDIDVLVSFGPDAHWSLFDWVDMSDELETIFLRKIDLVEKEALRNPFRRRSILEHREVIYAA